MSLRRLIASSILFVLFSYSSAILASNLNETGAIEYLSKKIERSKVYASWTTQPCLRFYTEAKSREYFDIEILEKHSEGCAGDPVTMPIVDRFRVYRKQYKILWRETESDRLLSFNRFLKSREVNPAK